MYNIVILYRFEKRIVFDHALLLVFELGFYKLLLQLSHDENSTCALSIENKSKYKNLT